VLKDSCDSKCCDECTKVIFSTYIIWHNEKATTCCITQNYFVVTVKNTLYFTKQLPDNHVLLKDKKTIEAQKKSKNNFDRIIELDSNINYIRLVSADSLFMFPKINYEHKYIQFETGTKVNEPDRVFIWDLFMNEAVATLDQPN
jgi:hypothetical protein